MAIIKLPAHVLSRLQPCLVLEDDAVILLDLEDTLRKLGLRDIRLAATIAAAEALISIERARTAILDYRIRNSTSLDLAQHLLTVGTAVVFVTGWGESLMLPPGLPDVRVLSKPLLTAELVAALTGIAAHCA